MFVMKELCESLVTHSGGVGARELDLREHLFDHVLELSRCGF